MKLTKMSLVAALLVAGTSAFAVDNVKVSGDAKLFYSTSDENDNDLFNKAGAAGQAGLGLGITSDLTKNVSAGAHVTALTTLGLKGQLVANVWEGTNTLTDSWWFDEAWMATTVGKTTAKIGRMELDTPLVFSENWSIAKNTFGAAVVINQDLPDTTLVGAYVGQGSGTAYGEDAAGGIANRIAPQPTDKGDATPFHQFYNGAYAVGIVNNSFKPLTAQAWYYDASSVATAYWLQADLKMEGVLAGVQYTSGKKGDGDSSGTFAVMAGYEMKDVATFKAAYSQTSDKGALHGQNLATAGATGGAQSKLYTEAWWNYGYVTRTDTSAFMLSGEANVVGVDVFAQYTQASVDSAENQDMSEITLTASKSFGSLDVTAAYIYTDAEDKNNGDASNTIQAYLTLNF